MSSTFDPAAIENAEPVAISSNTKPPFPDFALQFDICRTFVSMVL